MARIRTGKKFDWSFDRRFMTKIEKVESGCWVWLGSKMNNGYGQLSVGGARYSAHRYAYEQLVGPIPDGLDLDHLCRNRACSNPDHLEPVTRSVNLNRGIKKSMTPKKTHCPQGHEFSEANTYVSPMGKRLCRECAKTRAQANRDKKAGI